MHPQKIPLAHRLGQAFSLLLLVLVACWMAWMLTACAQLGLTQPKTFRERLAYSYSTVTAVRNSATQMLRDGSIDEDEYIAIEENADAVRAGLESARLLSKRDLPSAEQRLSATLEMLTALQVYLQHREAARHFGAPPVIPNSGS